MDFFIIDGIEFDPFLRPSDDNCYVPSCVHTGMRKSDSMTNGGGIPPFSINDPGEGGFFGFDPFFFSKDGKEFFLGLDFYQRF